MIVSPLGTLAVAESLGFETCELRSWLEPWLATFYDELDLSPAGAEKVGKLVARALLEPGSLATHAPTGGRGGLNAVAVCAFARCARREPLRAHEPRGIRGGVWSAGGLGAATRGRVGFDLHELTTMPAPLHTSAGTGRVSSSLSLGLSLSLATAAAAAPQSGEMCLIDSIPTGSIGFPVATDGQRVLLQLDGQRVAVFERMGPTWRPTGDLPTIPGSFGGWVAALDGTRALYTSGSGALKFLEEGPSGWTVVQEIPMSGGVGRIVGLEGDLAILDTFALFPFADDITVMQRGPAGWAITAQVPSDVLETGLAMSGRTLAIGTDFQATSPRIDLFEVNAQGGLVRTQRILPPTPAAAAQSFGGYIALSGDRLVAASLEDADGNGIRGTIHTYERGPNGHFQYVGRADDPPALSQIQGQPIFGPYVQLAGERMMVSCLVGSPAGTRTGQVVLDWSPAGWTNTALLDPNSLPAISGSARGIFAGDTLFLEALGPQDAIRRFAIGAPEGIQVCAGTAVAGPAPRLSLEGCSSAAAGQLVVRAEGLTGGTLLVGLARGASPVAPSGITTCIRPAGSLGSFAPIGPNTAEVAVAPALVQSLPAMLGQVLLIQGFQTVSTPAGGVSADLTNALAIELAD